MSRRAHPWRSKPSAEDKKLFANVHLCRLYVLKQHGPLSFTVKGDGDPAKYRVVVGERQECSCHTGLKLCKHLVFVMVKVLRLSPDNPLAWQLSLVDREIGDILSGKYIVISRVQRRAGRMRKAPASPEDNKSLKASRRVLEEGEPCPICYDDMDVETEAISFCEAKCGRGIHSKCMKVWAENREQSHELITCPLCRADWGAGCMRRILNDIKEGGREDQAKRLAESKTVSCEHVSRPKCSRCKAVLVYQRYRCVVCPSHDLCVSCFRRREHRKRTKGKQAAGYKHVFLERKEAQSTKAGGVKHVPGAWMTIKHGRPKPTGARLTNFLRDIQTREITTDDYDLLMALDGRDRRVPPYEFLARRGLPSAARKTYSTGELCQVCEQPTSEPEDGKRDAGTRVLPCGHEIHLRCLLGELLYDLTKCCKVCDQAMFAGLQPDNLRLRPGRTGREKKVNKKPKSGAAAPNLDSTPLGLPGLRGTGIGPADGPQRAQSSLLVVRNSTTLQRPRLISRATTRARPTVRQLRVGSAARSKRRGRPGRLPSVPGASLRGGVLAKGRVAARGRRASPLTADRRDPSPYFPPVQIEVAPREGQASGAAQSGRGGGAMRNRGRGSGRRRASGPKSKRQSVHGGGLRRPPLSRGRERARPENPAAGSSLSGFGITGAGLF